MLRINTIIVVFISFMLISCAAATYQFPTADFTANITSGDAPLTVTFTDMSSSPGAITSWSWGFGDGTGSTKRSPIHTYTEPGSYNVILLVHNSFQCCNMVTRAGYIKVYGDPQPPITNIELQPPVANLSSGNKEGFPPLSVRFTDASSGDPTKWEWDFGDGEYSTEQDVTHTYTNVGNYTVKLSVYNDVGNNTIVKKDYVKVLDFPHPPTANFSASKISGYAPLEVAFVDMSTNSPTGYLWYFGDGDTSRRSNPQHKYVDPGEYTVTLNVTNADGSNTITKNSFIRVYTDTQLTHPPHPVINLNVIKTKLNVRDNTFVILSAENDILKPPLHIQVTIIPPPGISVYSETFADRGAGPFSSNFTLAAGENRAITLGIIPIEEGNLDIKGLARYYYGFDTANISTVELNQTIYVSASKPEYIPTPNTPQSTSTTTHLIQRFLKYFY